MNNKKAPNDLTENKSEPHTKRKVLGEMREWILREDLMPNIIMQINRVHKPRYNEYLSNEFCHTEFAQNDDKFAVIETTKYPEYVFLQSANPHNLCLNLWNNQVLNKYIHQTYLIQSVTKDINYIATHKLLFGDNKIIKLFGDKKCISILGPLIPKTIKLSPSETKCTHILNIIKAYKKYYFGVFEKKYCYGLMATNVKLQCSKFSDSSISRAYFKLREIFLREALFFKSLKSNFIALDIGSSPGGWTKYLIDIGAKHVISVDPGKLKLDHDTMKSVTYHPKTIEKCIIDGDLAYFTNKDNRFDIIVCDVNMDPSTAGLLIHQLSDHLNDNGYIIFTLKMPDRKKFKMASNIARCKEILSESFENIKLKFLLANKSKERTLIATKKTILIDHENVYHFHEIHSF